LSWADAIPRDPLTDDHGLSRGVPLDRQYIEQFLSAHQDVIAGSVLEVQDSAYTARFGGNRVSESVVVDIDAANPAANLIADLCDPGSLADATYDCIILTQTLHLLIDPVAGIGNCWRSLRPGGSLLLTAPAMSRVSPTYPESDYWRFAPAGMQLLFDKHWSGPYTVVSYGNLRTCIGFLLARTAEETPEAVIDVNDPRYPLTVAVHAQKPPADG
jgi:SAM-dependent methyltransferase